MHGVLSQTHCKLARKFLISQSYVRVILKTRSIKVKKRTSAPKYTEKQLLKQRSKLRFLRETFFKAKSKTEVIVDDESFFTIDGSDCAGNSNYYYKEDANISSKVRYKRHTKFPKRALVWLAISSRGASRPFVIESGNSITADIYSKQCIRLRLVPFLRKFHSDMDFIFWPDMASSHYAASTLSVYDDFDITYIPKERNVPNISQLRPIERYWHYLKQKTYEGGWETDSFEVLKKRILLKIRQTPKSIFSNLMAHVKSNVRKAADFGADSLCK